MALDPDPQLRDEPSPNNIRADDRLPEGMYESDTGRSNFVAFLLGGVVIAGGMLAFLFFDADSMNRSDDLTTGSIVRMEAPDRVPSITIPAQRREGASTP